MNIYLLCAFVVSIFSAMIVTSCIINIRKIRAEESANTDVCLDTYSDADRAALEKVAELIADHNLELETIAQTVGEYLDEHNLPDPYEVRLTMTKPQ